MAGFTKEEVAAELARRQQVQRDIEIRRFKQDQRNQITNAELERLHYSHALEKRHRRQPYGQVFTSSD